MQIGIGLPNTVRGVEREEIVEWARRAEEAGFSSLGTLDRIVYPNYESLVTLAAAAAVTERIGLVTDIVLAPLRTNTPLSPSRRRPSIASIAVVSSSVSRLALAPTTTS